MKALKTFQKIILSCVLTYFCTACSKYTFSPVMETNDSLGVVPIPPPSKTITASEVVAYGNKQVDFLLVLDDSNSMLPELKKLAARLSTFVSSLEASNIDWQMCLTTTRGRSQGSTLVHGTNLTWTNYQPTTGVPNYLLKKGTPGLNTIFTSTIDTMPIGGANSGDERAIKATHDNFKDQGNHLCYRPGAAISVIVISDEDERSVGGDASKVKPKDAAGVLQALEPEDSPTQLMRQAQASFGKGVRFTFNAIIVKPDDKLCEDEQDLDTSPSHPGFIYAETAALTDGGVGSICESDYSGSLNTFKNKIVNSLSSLTLQCSAKASTMKVLANGLEVSGLKIERNILKFVYPLIEGTKIDLVYDCIDDL